MYHNEALDQPITTRLSIPPTGRYIIADPMHNNLFAYFWGGLHLGHAPSYQQAEVEIDNWLLAVQPIKEER